MESPIELAPVQQNNSDAEENNQSMVNPSVETDDCVPECLSPVLINMNSNSTNLQQVEDYEPHGNRVMAHPTTNINALLHLLKGSFGTGILVMPRAFAYAGYIMGSICTILIGVICTYCIHMLVDSCYVLCKRRKVPSLTYAAAAEAALLEGPDWCKVCSPYAAHVVNAFLLIYHIGTCCVYIIFVSENLHSVLVNQFKFEGVSVMDAMLCILLLLILINYYVRDLKYLALFSATVTATSLVSFGIILYYIFRETPTLDGKSPVGKLSDFPLFIGTVLFALKAIGMILPLENEMKTPKDFVGKFGVLNRAMVSIVILYVGMGLFGYLRYGNRAQGNITLNISNTEALASTVQCLLAFAIFVSHALSCNVAIGILWNNYIGIRIQNVQYPIVWEYLLRTIIVVVTFSIAAMVPHLDLFISLLGALCVSALGLAFPAIIQSCTYWHHVSASERSLMIIKNSIIVLMSTVGLIVGTWTSLEAIIVRLLETAFHNQPTVAR